MTATTDSPSSDASPRKLMQLRRLAGPALAVAIAAPLVSGALLLIYAALLARALGLSIEDGTPLSDIFPLIGVMIVIALVRALLGFVGEHAGAIGAERIKETIRNRLFGHLLAQRHPLGLRPASGAVGAALMEQVDGLENFFARYIPAMVAAAILPVAFAVALFPVDWIIALLFLITAPLIPLFMALAGWGAQAATDRQATALSRLSAYFADRLRGLLTLKLFGRAEDATRDVYEASEDLRRRTQSVLRLAFLSSAVLEFFAALGVAGVAMYVGLTYLGFLGINLGLTLASGMFALIMAPEVYAPLRQLAAHYHDRAAARSALAEIDAIVADIDDVAEMDRSEPASANVRALSVNVTGLVVSAEQTRILDQLDLAIAPGESVAIMGPSGSGKSTLARAIARLLPYDGAIDLDGIPLPDWEEAQLRGAVAFIAQKPRIFVGTIGDNIALADPTATPEAIQQAAKEAGVSQFADSLPEGLQTIVGEGGYGLSGGQAQRIGLARLYLTDPALVILDEPTAQLDPATEEQTLDALFRFGEGRTMIIVTHSARVARRAGTVLRMAGGRLLPTPHRTSAKPGKKEHRA